MEGNKNLDINLEITHNSKTNQAALLNNATKKGPKTEESVMFIVSFNG